MRYPGNPGFVLPADQIARGILIPTYYDPRVAANLRVLKKTHDLTSLQSLVDRGVLHHDQGSYVPKIYYGTGPFPYIRTSDLANWELKASPKHGVSLDIYDTYSADQDVQVGDILFVHEGTYLIGSTAIVTKFDGKILFQHHLARFRVKDGSPFGPYFLLVALETPIVQRQIRAKQFSADIIDSVVGRLGEVIIPIPKDTARITEIERKAEAAVIGRAEARERVSYITSGLELWLRGTADGPINELLTRSLHESWSRTTHFLGGRSSFTAFSVDSREVRDGILLPKYHDPSIAVMAKEFQALCDLITINDLVARRLVTLDTGDEIGKIQYGTGLIPFIRTSDLASWELKQNPKQGISEDVYNLYAEDQDVRAGDILLVRDGTYLVGSSVLLLESDLPLLYCGGMIKLRSLDQEALPPSLLFTLLNLPFARRQMRNKQFTRDVIDTLGRRFGEVVLPIPRSEASRQVIAEQVGKLLTLRSALRGEIRELANNAYGYPA